MHSITHLCLFLLAFFTPLVLTAPTGPGTAYVRVVTPPPPGAPPPAPRVAPPRPVLPPPSLRPVLPPPPRPVSPPPPPAPVQQQADHGGVITVAGTTHTLRRELPRFPATLVAPTWILKEKSKEGSYQIAKQFRNHHPDPVEREKQRKAFFDQSALNNKILGQALIQPGESTIRMTDGSQSGERYAWIVGPGGKDLRDQPGFHERYNEGHRSCHKFIRQTVRKDFVRMMEEFHKRTGYVHLNPNPLNTMWSSSGTTIQAFTDFEILDTLNGPLFNSVKQRYLHTTEGGTLKQLATALATEYYPESLCPPAWSGANQKDKPAKIGQ